MSGLDVARWLIGSVSDRCTNSKPHHHRTGLYLTIELTFIDRQHEVVIISRVLRNRERRRRSADRDATNLYSPLRRRNWSQC